MIKFPHPLPSECLSPLGSKSRIYYSASAQMTFFILPCTNCSTTYSFIFLSAQFSASLPNAPCKLLKEVLFASHFVSSPSNSSVSSQRPLLFSKGKSFFYMKFTSFMTANAGAFSLASPSRSAVKKSSSVIRIIFFSFYCLHKFDFLLQ